MPSPGKHPREVCRAGHATPDCDPDLIFDFRRGAILIRALTRGSEDGERFCRQTADALVTLATTPTRKG
ncbi:hypothetical protein [Nocardia abscessus]|uniref:hypothetical protein n=1 Tax=Nocardia abscessus TaxID=120957 RepID=UPI002453CE80|nr:hypothetical protein [Nocardia abscessus]